MSWIYVSKPNLGCHIILSTYYKLRAHPIQNGTKINKINKIILKKALRWNKKKRKKNTKSFKIKVSKINKNKQIRIGQYSNLTRFSLSMIDRIIPRTFRLGTPMGFGHPYSRVWNSSQCCQSLQCPNFSCEI